MQKRVLERVLSLKQILFKSQLLNMQFIKVQ